MRCWLLTSRTGCLLLLLGLLVPARAWSADDAPKKKDEAPRVSVLVVDGNVKQEESDYFFLSAFFDASGVYSATTVKPGKVGDLDLKKYRVVVMLNVPELP